jgi:uncharacterized protein (TIGR00730 family)
MESLQSICVYCGSSPGRKDIYVKAGLALGQAIAENGLRLIYGGGTKGIMGAVAEGAIRNGGKVTGIIPRFLMAKEATETALESLDEVIVTDDMHERKHLMFERSGAFVALPGGIGTVEEIIEIMTWAQLGRHKKPMIFANIEGFWNPMLSLLNHMTEEGFIHTAHRVKPLVAESAGEIVPVILDAYAHANGASGDEEVIGRL